jgi:hypothetical protein
LCLDDPSPDAYGNLVETLASPHYASVGGGIGGYVDTATDNDAAIIERGGLEVSTTVRSFNRDKPFIGFCWSSSREMNWWTGGCGQIYRRD